MPRAASRGSPSRCHHAWPSRGRRSLARVIRPPPLDANPPQATRCISVPRGVEKPMTNEQQPRVAILGAGPVGLEAALAVAERGWAFTVYEGASRPGGNVREWGHVRLFTPWDMNV